MALQQMTEDRPLSYARQVSLTTENWTVIVQVVEKHETGLAKNKVTRYKKYVLTDMEGTKISAVTYNTNIEPLEKQLIPFKRYQISNADVKLTPEQYRIGEYAFEWILKTSHLIHAIQDEVPHPLPCSFDFTNISELSPYAERNEYVAIKALVIQSNAVRGSSSSTRDYILINEEKIPIVLRLWNNLLDNDESRISAKFPEPTLIVGLNLRVTTFHGISLTTPRYNAYFLVDPPLPDADLLYDWYETHSMEIAGLLKNKAYDDVEMLLPPPKETYLRRIRTLTRKTDEEKAAWVKGRLQLIPGQDKLWQSVCGNCKKYFKGRVNWQFVCSSCGENSKIIPRGRMEVFLTDDSGTLPATVFSPLYEKLTNITPYQLHEADNKGQPLLKEVEAAIHGKEVYCFIKFYMTDKNYTAVQLYPKEEVPASEAIQMQEEDPTSIPAIVELPNKETMQFFSPNTKEILEEIAATPDIKDGTSLQSTQTKRTLMFGSKAAEMPTAGTEKGSPSAAALPVVHEIASPVKKMKNKEDHKDKGN